MQQSILVLGNPEKRDVDLCKSIASDLSFVVCECSSPEEIASRFKDDRLFGCISFCSCPKNSCAVITDALQSAGFSDIPLYQKNDSAYDADSIKELAVDGLFDVPLSASVVYTILQGIRKTSEAKRTHHELITEAVKYRKQKQQLIKIGTSLSLQNDLDTLLSSILRESRDIVSADAGSIYIRGKVSPGGAFTDVIRFKISQNDSIELGHKFEEFDIPIDQTTVAGYVASTGKLVTIEDVQALGDSVPYKTPRMKYEKQFEYPVKTMLTVPLKNMAQDVVGVLQLMNKKLENSAVLSSASDVEQHVVPFSLSDEDFILSIASQAAVSIERVSLYEEIRTIFEGYLRSSIAAIDERDRVTYGHSRRVMGYALAFADAVNKDNGATFPMELFGDERKTQFRFAALLHDIGKIGVPEALLTKETRLTREEMADIRMRSEYIRLLLATGHGKNCTFSANNEIDDDMAFIEKTNRAGFLDETGQSRIKQIAQKQYVDTKGETHYFLSEHEVENLVVRAGNLTKNERERINSHAQATRRLLSRIPWTKGLEQIPEIACHHHERLDGSGYPDGLKGDAICFESRSLAVIDIYEALVAQDRPYKPKMAPEKALEILRAEAKANHLDGTIVEFFISKGIYRTFIDEQNTNATFSS
jgi:HD-GYP domain-containing protein (c-di-GMP phosphodiesterase class II)